jgi:hypothetical protein
MTEPLVGDNDRDTEVTAKQESLPAQCSVDLSGTDGLDGPEEATLAECSVCTDAATMRQRRRQLVHGSTLRGDNFQMPTGSPAWWPWSGRCAAQHHMLSSFLEARWTHIAVIVLVVFDLAIVVTELILSSTFCDREKVPHAGGQSAGCLGDSRVRCEEG